MKAHLSRLSSLLLLLPLGLAVPVLQGVVQPVPRPVPVRWGLALQADEPFHAVGSTLHARLTLANGSAQDAAYWTLASGGNGCSYRFEVLDAGGRPVWQPGSVTGGVYSPPACLFGSRPGLMPAGTDEVLRAAIPLVHQNGLGLGVQGSPLPAGLYHLAVEVERFGPERPPSSFGPGLTWSARVPFRIE